MNLLGKKGEKCVSYLYEDFFMFSDWTSLFKSSKKKDLLAAFLLRVLSTKEGSGLKG